MRSFSALLSMVVLGYWTGGVRGEDAAKPLDDNLLCKMAPCAHAQIEISKLAEKRGSTPEVKEFAAKLVKDHSKCCAKMDDAIKTKKLTVDTDAEKKAKGDVDRLNKLEGSAFDREYLTYVIKTHKEAVSMFEAQCKDGKDTELCGLCKDGLPMLREHLKKAEALAKNTN